VVARRDWLKSAAAMLVVREALAQGRVEKGIYRVRGDVRVNGEPARYGEALLEPLGYRPY
jgi:hypothetical protein